jgi:hypothetical protein
MISSYVQKFDCKRMVEISSKAYELIIEKCRKLLYLSKPIGKEDFNHIVNLIYKQPLTLVHKDVKEFSISEDQLIPSVGSYMLVQSYLRESKLKLLHFSDNVLMVYKEFQNIVEVTLYLRANMPDYVILKDVTDIEPSDVELLAELEIVGPN